MKYSKHRLSLELAKGGDPPAEFRIFAQGENDTVKGKFLFDEKSAKSVFAAASDWNNKFSLDYEHDAVNPLLGGPKPAAGWFEIELREGALWAINVEWTPRASDMLRAREYRYVSPAFEADESLRVTELVNVALTNLPATKAMTPLVASKDTTMTDEKKLAADADATEAPVKTLFAADDAVSVGERTGVVAEVKSGEFVSVTFDDDKSSGWFPAESVAGGSAPEAEATSQVLNVLGAKSLPQALGLIAAGKAALEELTKLRAEKASEKAAADKAAVDRERNELIIKLTADKKLTPALKQWALSVEMDALRGFAGAAPTVTASAVNEPPKAEAKRWENYSVDDLAKLAKDQPELYSALKADKDQRTAR